MFGNKYSKYPCKYLCILFIKKRVLGIADLQFMYSTAITFLIKITTYTALPLWTTYYALKIFYFFKF